MKTSTFIKLVIASVRSICADIGYLWGNLRMIWTGPHECSEIDPGDDEIRY